jgi:hypothetical protein
MTAAATVNATDFMLPQPGFNLIRQPAGGMHGDSSTGDIPPQPPQYIRVLVPNGDECWQVGSTHNILWVSALVNYVRITLYKNGVYDSTIVSSTPSDGSYSWTIPQGQTPRTDYTIKIANSSNSNVCDFSDGPFIITLYANQVLWNTTYTDDGPSMRITTDTSNNIYACGGGNSENSVVIKYYPDGTEAWVTHPSSASESTDLADLAGYSAKGKDTQMGINYFTLQEKILGSDVTNFISDIVYDGYNSVYVCGVNIVVDMEELNLTCKMFIIQLDTASGNELWNKTFNFLQTSGLAMPEGITIDKYGDTYVTGSVLTVDHLDVLACFGLTIKIGPYGLVRYVKIDDTLGPVIYTTVETDSYGYPYEAGIIATDTYFTSCGSIIVKRTILGIITDDYSNVCDNTILWSMVIDKTGGNYIYVAGSDFSGDVHGKFGVVSKFSSSLTLMCYYPIAHEEFTDVALLNNILNNQYLVVTSKVMAGQYTISLIDRTNGNRVARFCIGDAHVTEGDITFLSGTGIAVDTNKNIVVCGGASVIDTIKCHVS